MRSRRPSMSCRLVNLDEATGRILRPSWAGEVAARSRKSREATDFAQTGWLLRRFFRSDLDPPPRLALYGRSAIFVDVLGAPPGQEGRSLALSSGGMRRARWF